MPNLLTPGQAYADPDCPFFLPQRGLSPGFRMQLAEQAGAPYAVSDPRDLAEDLRTDRWRKLCQDLELWPKLCPCANAGWRRCFTRCACTSHCSNSFRRIGRALAVLILALHSPILPRVGKVHGRFAKARSGCEFQTMSAFESIAMIDRIPTGR